MDADCTATTASGPPRHPGPWPGGQGARRDATRHREGTQWEEMRDPTGTSVVTQPRHWGLNMIKHA